MEIRPSPNQEALIRQAIEAGRFEHPEDAVKEALALWEERERPQAKFRETLFTFLRFPASQWKALRTTNALERINEEFRRRTKTQASLPSEEAVLFLLFGLLRSGQVRLRRLVGWQDLTSSQMEAA